jgi:tol-pal system protein YbgF
MILKTSLSILISLSLMGCLKSRAQLYEESDYSENRNSGLVVNNPKPVQPGGYAIEELKAEVMRLVGKVEDLERNNKSLDQLQAVNDKIQALENRISELENAQLAMLENLQKKEAAALKRSPEEIFKSGKDAFRSGQLDQAIALLKEYLKTDDKTNAEEARFLLGESFFSKKEFKDAIIFYSELNEKHPGSKRIPSALQKIAQSFERLGYKDDAKSFYQELLEKYPKSPEARASKNKLK